MMVRRDTLPGVYTFVMIQRRLAHVITRLDVIFGLQLGNIVEQAEGKLLTTNLFNRRHLNLRNSLANEPDATFS